MWQGMDQRRFPRVKYQCVVNLRQEGKRSTIPAVTENLGLGGVCVLLERELGLFAPVELALRLSDWKPPIRVQGTIVWVVRRGELKKGSRFDTGIEFAGISGEDKARLEAVLDKINLA